MKTCPNCSSENRDEAMFCTKCGTKFEEQPINTDINNAQDTTPINTIPTDDQVTPPTAQPAGNYSAPVQPQPAPKKKSKALVMLLGLVAVIAIAFFAFRFLSSASPAEKLIMGLAKLSKSDKTTTSTTVNIEYDGDQEEIELLNDISFKIETAADVNNLLAQVTLDFLYAKKPVIQVAAGVNNEDIYVDLKDLYKNQFYQAIDDIAPGYEDFLNDYKIVKKAFDSISLKFDNKEYIKIFKDVLDDNIKGSGNKVVLTLDSKTLNELIKELFEEAEDDKKLMETIRKNSIAFIEKIIKEEKNLELIDVDDLEDALEILEDKDDFEDYYQEALSQAISSMEYMDFDIDDLPEIELTFQFGAGNSIKGIDYTAEIDQGGETFKIISTTDIKSGASFTKINKKNAIEINELMTGGEDIEDIVEDITENLTKAIKKNKELTKKIEELSGEDVEDAIEMLMYGAFGFMG
ncbi:MAG: zinc-ribbon domain-containing protein [Clostridiaceae bacterium]|jgi:hypothetical protein|nr:zinc-ribbon domain-containing protein [Clostridiaceae bacterium]